MITLDPKLKISLLLPTRKRVKLLQRSIDSILNTVSSIDNIEILIAIDSDDLGTTEYLNTVLVPNFQSRNINMRAFTFERQGYAKLHLLYNYLATKRVS